MHNFTVHSTNHTSFTVSDLDRSIAFFRDALGFEVTSRAPRDPAAIRHITGVAGADIEVAYIRGPGHSFELIQYHAPEQRSVVDSRPCDSGFAHIAFDVDNIEAALSASKPHGMLPINSPWVIDKGPNAGKRVVYCRDSDGVTVEFIGP